MRQWKGHTGQSLSGKALQGNPSTIVYPADSEAESGDYPETSISFAQVESGVSLSPEGENFDLYYNTDAAKEAAEE